MDPWLHGSLDRCVDVHGWMDGGLDGWRDVWIDGMMVDRSDLYGLMH